MTGVGCGRRADGAAGHTGPALQGAAFYGADRVVRPYEICHCEERSDAAIRSPQSKETDSHASDTVTGSE